MRRIVEVTLKLVVEFEDGEEITLAAAQDKAGQVTNDIGRGWTDGFVITDQWDDPE